MSGTAVPVGHADDIGLVAALKAFQMEAGIEVTGELDEATINALREAHGS